MRLLAPFWEKREKLPDCLALGAWEIGPVWGGSQPRENTGSGGLCAPLVFPVRTPSDWERVGGILVVPEELSAAVMIICLGAGLRGVPECQTAGPGLSRWMTALFPLLPFYFLTEELGLSTAGLFLFSKSFSSVFWGIWVFFLFPTATGLEVLALKKGPGEPNFCL